MVLATATISGQFFLPDGVTPRGLHVSIVPVLNGLAVSVKSAAESVVLSGTVRASTVGGTLTVSLPILTALEPAGTRWRGLLH